LPYAVNIFVVRLLPLNKVVASTVQGEWDEVQRRRRIGGERRLLTSKAHFLSNQRSKELETSTISLVEMSQHHGRLLRVCEAFARFEHFTKGIHQDELWIEKKLKERRV
jgi:hypothetical protein